MTEGDKAPDFTLETAAGPVSLADYAGKTLVLYFYPKDDTTGCTREAQDFSALLPQFRAAGAEVLGVSKDSLKSHDRFAAKYGLAVPLASDPEAKTIAAFGSWVKKTLYGREYMGVDRSTFLIRDGVVRRAWRKVRTPGHAEAVLEAVRAL